MIHSDVKRRDIDILEKLRRGWTPARTIDYVVDQYGLTEKYAWNVVYDLNSKLKKSTKELCDEAAEYIKSVLISEIEDCADEGDRRNKLKAIELLAKACKVGESDNKLNLEVQFGFNDND